MRFLIDEDLGLEFEKLLGPLQHDVLSVQSTADLCGKDDVALAAIAEQMRRVLVTGNHRDFVKIAGRRQPKGRPKLDLSIVMFKGVDSARRLQRFQDAFDLILFEYRNQTQQGGQRMVIEIHKAQIVVSR